MQVTLLEHNHSHPLKNSRSILRDCVRWALALFRLGEAPMFFHLNPFFVQRLSKVLFCCMLRLPSPQQQQRAAKAAMCAPYFPAARLLYSLFSRETCPRATIAQKPSVLPPQFLQVFLHSQQLWLTDPVVQYYRVVQNVSFLLSCAFC